MKKIFVTSVLAFTVFFAQAQVNFGARGGVSMTTLVGDGYDAKPGFHLGGFANLPVKNGISIQPEIYYASQGANWEVEGKTQLGYLNIPVLAKYNSNSRFYGETGPQVGFMLSAFDTYDGEKDDVKKYLNTTDFSWALGAGFQVNKQLGFGLRYNLGITSFWKSEKNSVVQLGLHYTFPTSRK